MPIGRKLGSLGALKTTLAKGNSQFIKYIPKDGSITVRFLEEPENWINYLEHWDESARKSYPCTEENECPGCMELQRRSPRYLANALDVDNDKVIPLMMPKDLTNRLVIRYEKYDTIMDRDYELTRSGSGLDTVYDAAPEPPMARKVSKYQLHDLMQVLNDAFQAAMGKVSANAIVDDDDDEDEVDERPVRRKAAPAPKKRMAALRPVEEEDDEDEDEEEAGMGEMERYTKKQLLAMDRDELLKIAAWYEINTVKRKVAGLITDILAAQDEEDEEEEEEEPRPTSRRRTGRTPTPTFEPDDEDEEDEDGPDDDASVELEEDEDDFYSEDDLKEMSLGEIRAVAKEYGLKTQGVPRVKLIEMILESEEPF